MGNGGWLQALDRTTATVQSAWGSGGIIIIQYDLTSKKGHSVKMVPSLSIPEVSSTRAVFRGVKNIINENTHVGISVDVVIN